MRLGCSIRDGPVTCTGVPCEGLLAAAVALGWAMTQVWLGIL